MDPTGITKTYWSILKIFLNNKKKGILPINHNSNHIADFKEKIALLSVVL